jgi:hypothetical protein
MINNDIRRRNIIERTLFDCTKHEIAFVPRKKKKKKKKKEEHEAEEGEEKR